MDKNKLEMLREVGYRIPRCCHTCVHAQWRNPSMWGTCARHTYQHAKHTGPPRQMSIFRAGVCQGGYERDEAMHIRVQHYGDLVDG